MFLLLFSLVTLIHVVVPHGRIIDPPGRSTMWRYGFDTPQNYDDNALFCGGRAHQWEHMNGLCGLCGDPYDQRPRPHEAGGKYAKGIVTETFLQGQIINVKIEVTANHGGVFAFRLCPLLWYMGEANEPCFERNQLRLVDGSSKFIIPPPAVARVYSIPLVLPQGVICTRCVIQWTWTTANSWGCDDNTECCIGCGPQEQFVNCADIAIIPVRQGQRFRPPMPVKPTPTRVVQRDKKIVVYGSDGKPVPTPGPARRPIDTKPAPVNSQYQQWQNPSSGPQPYRPPRPALPHVYNSYIPKQPQIQAFQTGLSNQYMEPSYSSRTVPKPKPQPRPQPVSPQVYNAYIPKPQTVTSRQTGSNPHVGQPYSSRAVSNRQMSPPPARRAPTGPVAESGYGSPKAASLSDVPSTLLSQLASLMKSGKPPSCHPKFQSLNVDCNRNCAPSGNHCLARKPSESLNTACMLLCSVAM
ncbi:uncharacterized protein LOC124115133 [Haliotis rufescens]|uniref:uncharacterized protein LOC124115133 n=1 Tax=Haliotis rufescens TaxID=6454 RepID=UPI00201F601F|nr:uncharacterized protein LOC124115133 [Haliotis rufescens]XP_048251104.1 uncharacterized protein LOC124115133 [Haliotis rufescens]XP_048251105.1 uncharacterized protein LOC124115133 [Haliotis rufescens]XP_048251106.1 uncharacterized protein LOC124115133 [Haliotis rufescens]XP_048251107.1 uncharacterized protein LOC124115133 [Haliotis rufescens]XP_048251108.1 uncharacterized protein LOC124115133 [Haliotis rufescens]XP_048251109.1 uncharacterized protein LOC124115133 [Haliotis rufescens]XP_0